MSAVGARERQTQRQVLDFLRDSLGYRHLGDWKDRADNRPIEEGLLRDWLAAQGHDENLITRALRKPAQAALSGSRTLYDANRAVYDQLRYGVKVRSSIDAQTRAVWLVDWNAPANNR